MTINPGLKVLNKN